MEAKEAVYSVLHSISELMVCGHEDETDNNCERLPHKTTTELKKALSVHENLAL